MHLCVIAGTFHPEPGGPPTYLYHLLPALMARGHTVQVITYGEAAPAEQYPYPIMRLSRRTSIPQRLLAFTRAIIRCGRAADALFVSDYGLPAALANLILGKPLVIKIVADFAWEFASRRGWTALPVVAFQTARHPARVRLVRSLQSWYARRADSVIVPGQHVAWLVQGWGVPPGRIHVILNALPAAMNDLPSRQEARRMLGWPEGPALVTVGRLAEVKRIDLQIQALPQTPAARLVIVGDGPERSALERLAADLGVAERVTFTGALPHDRALLAIRAADLLVLSSQTEGLSHVLIEALRLGTPCVATAVGGNPEVIRDGVDGVLVPPGDPAALAAAVSKLLADPGRMAALAAAGPVSAERFSWQRLVEDTEAVLLEVSRG